VFVRVAGLLEVELMKLKNLCVVFLLALLAAPTWGITLNEIARFDVATSSGIANPEFVGSNPAAVAWNGRELYIAGWNATGADADVKIVEITNALSLGQVAATYGAPFGSINSVNNRGYTGLDVDQNTLAAAADTVGGVIPEGIAVYDLDGTQRWTVSARGGSGVGLDPGFGGVDSGVGWTTFGSGRRALQNTASGADIYTTADGMIINGANTGTFWRDMNFAPNGDIWLREGNNVISGIRSGGNALSATNLVVDEPEADGVPLQTIAYMAGTPDGDVVIYNDREVTSVGQNFADVIKFVQPDGTPVDPTVNLLGPVDTGVGAYDFSYDAATSTLAISDFANRNVHIFSVVPEPGTGILILFGIACLLVGRRSR
jgi:hypothetical protein